MKALLPVFDDERNKPYYIQLYNYIKEAILTGEMREDEKLPSLRSLAKSTGLSITTIEQGYNQLLVEGYITSKPQSGYYVSRVFANKQQTVPAVSDILTGKVFTSDNSSSGTPSMQYDPECFDFNKWKKCMNRILTDFSPTLFFEGDPQGEMGLRKEISRYLYVSRGVICSPEQVIVGAGTQQITNHVATLLRRRNIEYIALENPGYLPVRNAFRDRGFAITPVDVAGDGILIEKLPANIPSAAYVSPSNHAFTGAVMPVGRRYELLNWADTNVSYIIEDDYDSELRYFGKPVPALRSLDSKERVIYLGSFSSTLFGAVKISYMVLPESMAGDFSSIAGDYSQTCSKLEQLTLAMFMESGYYQTHIKKIRKLYSQKLDRVISAFEEKAGDFVNVVNTSSGINIILQVHSGKPAKQLKKDAESLGIPCAFVGNISSAIRNSSTRKGYASLILYYNQIPLKSITDIIDRLLLLWKQ